MPFGNISMPHLVGLLKGSRAKKIMDKGELLDLVVLADRLC